MLGDEGLERVSSRDLRNRTADVIARVERGESLIVTVDRRPVARLVPLPTRETWVPRERIAAQGGIVQADPGLADDLRELFSDTLDDFADSVEEKFRKFGGSESSE